jgi:hypothetical protein
VVTATYPNPCEIDVDFGTVSEGDTATAIVQIGNKGYAPLDIGQVVPDLDGAFALDTNVDVDPPGLDAGPFAEPPTTIEPETFYFFLVVFEPYTDGGATSAVTIQTDGENSACPAPSSESEGDVLKINLTGAGAAPDAGSM